MAHANAMSGATERAYEIIRDAIISGEYAEGRRLREEDLAARTSVSRTPVREAIRRLASEGFLAVQPRSGAVVTRWTAEEVRDLFGLRAALESYAAGLAATRAREEDIAELDAMCDEMDDLAAEHGEGFLERFSRANTAFHARLLQLSGNRRLELIAASLLDLGLIMKTYKRFSRARIVRSCADHRDIVAALRRGDVTWSEAIMRAHILASVELHQPDRR